MKPVVKLVGTDGNVFSVIGTVSASLKKEGRPELAKEFVTKALASHSYYEVLALVGEYVDVE